MQKPFILFLLGLSLLISCDRNPNSASSSKEALGASNADSGDVHQKLIESRESPYNNIYVYQAGSNVSMTFGYNKKIYTESLFNTLDDRELPVPYTRFMSSSLMYAKDVRSILEIGSGGGRVSWYLHRLLPDAQITTVELDPVVSDLSRKYFGLKDEPNFRQVTRDGRLFLSSSKEKYDIILLDAYRGPFVPFHLLTKQFYQLVKEHLSEGGVVAQNIEPSTMLFDSDVNTLHEVFTQLEFYDASGNDKGGNVVLIAYDGDSLSRDDIAKVATEREFKYTLRYDLREMLAHRFLLKPVLMGAKVAFDVVDVTGRSTAGIDENAKVLTDDFAPVESLKAIENHNRRWETSQ